MARLIEDSVLPYVELVHLTGKETLDTQDFQALAQPGDPVIRSV